MFSVVIKMKHWLVVTICLLLGVTVHPFTVEKEHERVLQGRPLSDKVQLFLFIPKLRHFLGQKVEKAKIRETTRWWCSEDIRGVYFIFLCPKVFLICLLEILAKTYEFSCKKGSFALNFCALWTDWQICFMKNFITFCFPIFQDRYITSVFV